MPFRPKRTSGQNLDGEGEGDVDVNAETLTKGSEEQTNGAAPTTSDGAADGVATSESKEDDLTKLLREVQVNGGEVKEGTT